MVLQQNFAFIFPLSNVQKAILKTTG